MCGSFLSRFHIRSLPFVGYLMEILKDECWQSTIMDDSLKRVAFTTNPETIQDSLLAVSIILNKTEPTI